MRRAQVLNLSGDRFKNATQVLGSIRIPEANHSDTTISEPLVTLAVRDAALGLRVLAPIKLNRETQRRAIEIQNERAGRMLPPKIDAELSVSQLLP